MRPHHLNKMVRLMTLTLANSALCGALAQSPAQIPAPSDLQILVEEANGLIPTEYHAALDSLVASGTNGMAEAFNTRLEQGDCRFGIRSGTQIATSLMKGLKPSCDRLLAPSGTEWIPPAQPSTSSAFGRCFNVSFSRTVSQIVFDTAQLCAWQGFETSLTAAQIEYNRCYLAVANEASFAAFIMDPFEPGHFALIPKDSDRWNNLLATIRSQYGQQSGYLSMACEAGKTDAEAGMNPQNLLKRQ